MKTLVSKDAIPSRSFYRPCWNFPEYLMIGKPTIGQPVPHCELFKILLNLSRTKIRRRYFLIPNSMGQYIQTVLNQQKINCDITISVLSTLVYSSVVLNTVQTARTYWATREEYPVGSGESDFQKGLWVHDLLDVKGTAWRNTKVGVGILKLLVGANEELLISKLPGPAFRFFRYWP